MDKRGVADVLEEIGTLLDLKGENVFKTRAYHNAARLILSLEEDLGRLVEQGRLTDIKGIGQALADKITELVTTGRLQYHEELKASFPAGFMELLRVPGLGPKKARRLLDEIGIASVDELEAAARGGKLAGLDGFGERSQEKILEGIAHIRKSAERFLISVAEGEAAGIVGALETLKAVRRLSVAGSLRRRGETIKDIDLVVATDDPRPIMKAFVSLPGVDAITGHGETKSSVRLRSGMAADLRCVSDDEFPFALMYFTGSKAHNVALRGRAVKQGLRLNEYGLYRGTDSDDAAARIPCRDEAAIYKVLGLRYVEPELREDTGEIEAAESGHLPRLIEERDIRGLLHQHTTWSDGRSTLDEMVRAAIDMGLEYFAITDHSRTAQYARGLTIERVREQKVAVEAARAKYQGRITLFWGIESDILADGSLDYPDEVLGLFDFVVASVHSQFGLSEKDQTQRIVTAVSNPHTRILGHPSGRLLLEREPYAVNMRKVLEACAAHHVAVEINASPYRLDLDWREMRAARELGCLLSINPDSHDTDTLVEYRYGVGVARKGWLGPADVINTLDAAGVARFLRPGKAASAPKKAAAPAKKSPAPRAKPAPRTAPRRKGP